MDHDLKSLQVFIEGEFKADREALARIHAENIAANALHVLELAKVTVQTTATNGRLQKVEVAVAILKFAVYTIGGGLLLFGAQLIMARLNSL